ncbi:AMIN domain-containing protein [Brevibacillus laterosporus]|uniref:N-acetylmuramoyl-L-alanine amidase LytC n=1 Tax=Brevibacillus laterosporus LMG 15441 TaxID=1042163 RepID=A0A075R0W0_BRELA|nr:N-acetylmuramoyl-L-alanine amidase family protein [Brevibacillus laterosporus]HAS01778.1 AMIN domain-containing protein [Brevibacillus sp.]AIG24798.1 N-acetylmuramoyl-L-alanine amidase LytC precursor [Brevibacillus laterosporus LMG 15441]ERM16601.1 N-acetylmuramoyl-L-alanine amidase [Brevibacillus laterosporus PE36]MCR8997734.1 N-acetylmuramoyl-L-alanine amidase family protein [Brevibacillus laterosporus]RJL07850.1 AMIN domain-containing protein [Brevibacillus laterosporus]
MKKFVLGLVALSSFIWMAPQAIDAAGQSTQGNIQLRIEGRSVNAEVPPLISNGRTLVPVRVIAEGLGAKIDWNQQERKAKITKDNREVILQLSSKKAYINGKAQTLEATPELINNRMLLPLRFVGEALGATVGWDNDSRTVIVNQPVQTQINGQSLPATEKVYHWEDKVLLPVKTIADRLGVSQDELTAKASLKKVIDSTTVISLQDITDSIGTDVAEWDEKRNEVVITRMNRLTDIEPQDESVQIQTRYKVSPTVSVLQNPYRIVMDFPEMELSNKMRDEENKEIVIDQRKESSSSDYSSSNMDSPEKLELSDGDSNDASISAVSQQTQPLIRSIRYSQYQDNPKTVRVVVELNRSSKYQLVSTNDGVKLQLQAKPQKTGYLIVVDAGHGGHDVGAKGTVGNYEKDFTLSVANRLVEYLKQHKEFQVIATRSTDTYLTLKERTDIANEIDADVFISVHANSFNPETRGTETYYYNQNSLDLARVVHKHLLAATQFPDRKVKQNNFYVVKNTKMPAVLTETGFLTNQIENTQLMSPQFQDKVAKSLADAIFEYYQTY